MRTDFWVGRCNTCVAGTERRPTSPVDHKCGHSRLLPCLAYMSVTGECGIMGLFRKHCDEGVRNAHRLRSHTQRDPRISMSSGPPQEALRMPDKIEC